MHATDEKRVNIYGRSDYQLRCMYVKCCGYILLSASALCIHECMSAYLLVLLFINPLLLLVCLCVLWLYFIVLVVLSSACPFSDSPSVHLSVRTYVRMYVCMYVHTYLRRDERTSVCTVDIENWIDLADTLSGLSLHWTLISFGFFWGFFVSRFKGRHCRYVHLFMQKLCLWSPK